MKKLIFIVGVIIICSIAAGWYFFGRSKEPSYDFIAVERGDLVQEVSVTGRIKPALSVDLAFEKGGKASRVYAKIGAKVKEGEKIVVLENNDLFSSLLQAEANFETEKAKLDELEKGTRPEEILAGETKVANAEVSLQDAKANLLNIEKKADADIKSVYDGAFTACQKSASIAKNSLLILTDIQYGHFLADTQDNIKLAEAKEKAIYSLFKVSNTGKWSSESVAKLNSGLFGDIQNAENPAYEDIDEMLSSLINALQKTKESLELIPVTDQLTSAEKTSINTEKNNIVAEITAISGKQQAIEVQKIVNSNAIAAAKAGVNSANSALLSAKDDLMLKKAGATAEQIEGQKARVKSARANIENIRAQIDKTIMLSPINGIITKQDAKPGEIIPAGKIIASVISEAKVEIETNISEADIAKISIGNAAKVTLDAYGDETVFNAKVAAIEPAETIIEGVATYKTTLDFAAADERIKPGMTANIDILTDSRENVIVVPQRAVFAKDGYKFVQLIDESGAAKETAVEVGLRGSNGNIEIIEGVKEGDKIITFLKEK